VYIPLINFMKKILPILLLFLVGCATNGDKHVIKELSQDAEIKELKTKVEQLERKYKEMDYCYEDIEIAIKFNPDITLKELIEIMEQE